MTSQVHPSSYISDKVEIANNVKIGPYCYLNGNIIIGENTDVFGLQAAYLKEIDSSSYKSALVIGAGGVSPSVILSLQKSGIKKI